LSDDRLGGGAQPSAYALRVTTVFRREAGEWKVVHRHGDPYDETAEDLARRIRRPETD
jgi:ketosteroid isomerase-like protein